MAGPECCSNPPTLDPSSGSGHVHKFAGLNSYLSGSPNSNRAILFLSDVFGYEASLLRKLADKVAAAGYYVVVPDFFNGDPFNYDNVNRPLPVWIKDHGVDKGFEAAKPIIEALKSKGASAIGAAGFCWGGVDIPIAILGAEIDKYSPPELVKQFEQILTAKSGVDSLVKIFPKVSHGWTVRYNTEDAEAMKAAEEAHQNLLDWFARLNK